jgi:putative FmdB family regulatory protein
MPLHRHECESCGHQFRILVVHGTQNDTPTCPKCGSTVTRRMMPLVAVHFKGSGYYKTDHGRKGGVRPDKGGEASKDSAETKSTDESSVESKKKPSSDTKAQSKSSDSASSGKSKSSADD